MTEYVAEVARKTVGADRFLMGNRSSMGGEDFAYYLEKIPGCFFLIGVESPGKPCPNLHTDLFDFPDGAIPVGMKMFLALVKNFKV